MRKKQGIIGLVGAVVIVAAVVVMAVVFRQAPEVVQPTVDTFAQDYPSVASDHPFVAVSGEDAVRTIQTGTGMVFLGFPECPWCQKLAPLIARAAKEEGFAKVSYFNLRTARENNDQNYRQLVSLLKEYLPTDENGAQRISVPDVTAVKDGKIVGRYKSEPVAEGETADPETYWTAERTERALTQLRELMRQTR